MSCRGHCDQLQTKLVRLQSVDYMQYKAFVETFGDAFMSRTDHVRVLYLCLSVCPYNNQLPNHQHSYACKTKANIQNTQALTYCRTIVSANVSIIQICNSRWNVWPALPGSWVKSVAVIWRHSNEWKSVALLWWFLGSARLHLCFFVVFFQWVLNVAF